MSHVSYKDKARHSILFAVSLLSLFMHCVSEVYLRATKRILRYVKCTVDYGVKFERCHEFRFYGFSDSDWAGSIDDMKSTSRILFQPRLRSFLMVHKEARDCRIVYWSGWIHSSINNCKSCFMVKFFLCDLDMQQKNRIEIFVDKQAAITIANNPVCVTFSILAYI